VSVRLILEVDRTEYRPGDEVTGKVVVGYGGRSRRLEVFLLFRERTKGFEHEALRIGSGPLTEGGLEEGQAYRFAIRLPPDAPPNIKTQNAELFWEVDARSDQLGRDAHARQRIQV
jgi:hypothetical protein